MSKIVYILNRDNDLDPRPYHKRSPTKDRRLMLLDAAGNTYRFPVHIHNNPSITKVQDSCIDLQTDSQQFFAKHLIGQQMTIQVRSISF